VSPVAKSTGEHECPINALTPYFNKWTIRGRVTSKKEIRTYSNQRLVWLFDFILFYSARKLAYLLHATLRGEGKLFSFDIVDSHGGEIKVTAFNSECEKYFPMITVRVSFPVLLKFKIID
jgi:replication factor A1